MSDIVQYKVLTENCDNHLKKLYVSKYLAEITRPTIVREIYGNNFRTVASGPQVDTIREFMQCTDQYIHDDTKRKGYFLGDEMGTGKTRIIGGSLYQCVKESINQYNTHGRHLVVLPKSHLDKPLMTVCNAMQIHMGFALNFLKMDDVIKKTQTSYEVIPKDGVLIVTYTLFGLHSDKILSWLNDDKTCFIAFDESHHLKDSKTNSAISAKKVLMIMKRARVLFSSGTGATTVTELHLVGERLGLWTHDNFKQVAKTLNGRTFFMYLAIQMTRQGSYISRMLSKEHTVERITSTIKMTPSAIQLYNDTATLMSETMALLRQKIATYENKKHATSRLYGMSLAFFREMLLLIRMDHITEQTQEFVKKGKAVVISIQSTGEAYHDRDIQGIANTVINFLDSMIEKHPEESIWPELIQKWKTIDLPHQSVIDILMDNFGGEQNVADLTARQKRWFRDENMQWAIKTRSAAQILKERDNFQLDNKPIAFISKASNEGICLHAEYENSKQRVYIKGQKYWTATEQLQSEARVARTGQTSTPIIFDIVVEDICELTIDSRQNSSSRNLSSITQAGQNILAIGDQLSDAHSQRGYFAITRLLTELSDPLNNRGMQTMTELNLSDEEYTQYKQEAIVRLKDIGAMECMQTISMKRKRDADSDEHDASEHDKNTAYSVRQFFNRILLCNVELQNILTKHIAMHLRNVHETSTHQKPVKQACKIASREFLQDGLVLLKVASINKFIDVEKYQPTYYMNEEKNYVCAMIRVGRVSWRITPKDCVPTESFYFKYTPVSAEEARECWDRHANKKYILENLPVSEISYMRSHLGNDTPLQCLDNSDGGNIIGFNIPIRCLSTLRELYEV